MVCGVCPAQSPVPRVAHRLQSDYNIGARGLMTLIKIAPN
jgi:hypothetical protein